MVSSYFSLEEAGFPYTIIFRQVYPLASMCGSLFVIVSSYAHLGLAAV